MLGLLEDDLLEAAGVDVVGMEPLSNILKRLQEEI
jgi:hypothetical protein